MKPIAKMAGPALAASILCSPGFAQNAASSAGSEEAVSEVLITGSRIATTTYNTPTPVTTLSAEQIKARGAMNLIDLLQDIPTVRPGNNTTISTNIGAAAFDMRSLGSIRTLTMIDGRRAMDSNAAVSPIFDINLVPGGLIKSMDIVTAGASSVYGSDAVTGVVNILMDSEMTGLKIDAQAGKTQHGGPDNTWAVDMSYGRAFAEGRGHVVIAASFYDRPDILYQKEREWGRAGHVLLTNPAYTPTNGQYRQLILPNATLSRVTNGGLILNATTTTTGAAANNWAFRNVQFGAGGVQSPFQLGNYVGGVWMQGGGGLFLSPEFAILATANKRSSAFGRVTYDFTDNLQGFGELLYAETDGHYTNTIGYDSGTIIIRRDNAFLPANILASMVANNIASFTMGRMNAEFGRVNNYSENSYVRPVLGLKGDINDTWHWDASAVFTRAKYSAVVTGNRDEAKWALAKDSVIGPNGQPICRSTLTNPTNGCVPVNLFGENTITPQAIAYLGGTSHNDTTANGLDVSANLIGALYHTWAGPIGASVGAEYRKEDLDLETDPVAAVNGWRQAASAPYRGEVNVKELYSELNIPLLKDVPLARSLELSLAGRGVDYSTSGRAEVYKIGGNWTVSDQIRIRATYSKDFRAPKLSELFAANFESQGATVVDRVTNVTVPIRTVTGGNPDLKPEVAKTKTIGVVLQPEFAPRLLLSADYFDIQLDNAISTLTGQDVIDRCFAGAQDFCAGITRDAVGAIFRVKAVSYNATYLKTNGWDLQASYRLPVSSLFASQSGDLSFGGNFTYTAHLETLASGLLIDRAGQLTAPGVPHWRGTLRTTYTNDPVSISLLGNYVGKGKYDTTYGPLDINKNDYPAYFYLAVNAGYDISEAANIFLKVDNLLDKDPPLLAGNTIIRAQAAGSAGFHDQLGRAFTLGVRVKF
jgi:outer membrane receptor protein involved in Fe transport